MYTLQMVFSGSYCLVHLEDIKVSINRSKLTLQITVVIDTHSLIRTSVDSANYNSVYAISILRRFKLI